MKYLILVATLTGCAVMSPTEEAQRMGNAELCYKRHYGTPYREVVAEHARRGLRCDQNMINAGAGVIAQQEQGRRELMQSISDAAVSVSSKRAATPQITCTTIGHITTCN